MLPDPVQAGQRRRKPVFFKLPDEVALKGFDDAQPHFRQQGVARGKPVVNRPHRRVDPPGQRRNGKRAGTAFGDDPDGCVEKIGILEMRFASHKKE